MRPLFALSIVMLGTVLFACDNKGDPEKPKNPTGDPAASASPHASTSPASIARLGFPGTEEGAKALLQGFLKPGASRSEMSKSLKPSDADYDAIFDTDVATKAKAAYAEHWNNEDSILEAEEGQTELLLWKATTEQFRDGSGDVSEFPSGYKKVADKLKPGLTFYRFKFVKPENKHGATYDGLVFVNGHWVMVSKPYRVVE